MWGDGRVGRGVAQGGCACCAVRGEIVVGYGYTMIIGMIGVFRNIRTVCCDIYFFVMRIIL